MNKVERARQAIYKKIVAVKKQDAKKSIATIKEACDITLPEIKAYERSLPAYKRTSGGVHPVGSFAEMVAYIKNPPNYPPLTAAETYNNYRHKMCAAKEYQIEKALDRVFGS